MWHFGNGYAGITQDRPQFWSGKRPPLSYRLRTVPVALGSTGDKLWKLFTEFPYLTIYLLENQGVETIFLWKSCTQSSCSACFCASTGFVARVSE
jgi:hypothetical protein